MWPSGSTPAKRARRVLGGEGQRHLDLGVPREGAGPLEVRAPSARRPASSRPACACFRAGSDRPCRRGERRSRRRARGRPPRPRSAATRGRRTETTPRRRACVSASATPLRCAICRWWRSTRGPTRSKRQRPQLAELAAVERDLERARAAGEARAVEELLVPAGDLEEELPLARVPVERQEAVVARQVPRAVGDRGSPIRSPFPPAARTGPATESSPGRPPSARRQTGLSRREEVSWCLASEKSRRNLMETLPVRRKRVDSQSSIVDSCGGP